ncbi:sensor histidine kinase [Nocardioides cheoyonin]|uniref:sensor histidine kinase n=1 Tax=Nocardioides cheoyonin TaxID=3156615 RepID=UPI0032B3F69E
MAGALARLGARFMARVEHCIERKGLDYPWWDPVFSSAGIFWCTVIALAQRDAFAPPSPLLLAGVLLIVPTVARFLLPDVPWLIRNLWVVDAVPGLVGGAWILWFPGPSVLPTHDFGPAVLAVLTTEIVSREGPRVGLVCAVGALGVISYAAALGTITGLAVHLLLLFLGYAIGFILVCQMRALRAERIARAREHERATLAERGRIAREIHDLVGHSLSVTLLHLTGARRAIAENDDPAEVVDALREAEEVGRRAMAEIRRTVSTLTDGADGMAGAGGLAPLPTACDLEELVDGVRHAGQPVDCRVTGEVSALSPALGLGVYRITQESLSNAIKHAPGAPVTVRLEVGDDVVRLSVRNPLGEARRVGTGAGLPGMTARAEQLGGRLVAGPDGTDWVVDLTLPLAVRHVEEVLR